MLLSKEIMSKIEGKLSRPLHITYIARYIIELPVDETRNLLLFELLVVNLRPNFL